MRHMKIRILLFLQVIACTAMAALGAQVDTDAALATAARFLNPGNRLMASSSLRLVHNEPSAVDAKLNDYYIFNTSDNNRYVIVAGDDRASSILAYGEGAIDMDDLPDGMVFLLELYKGQIDYLHAHPDMVVRKMPRHASSSISPLLKSLWDQGEPYNEMCPMDNGKRSVTGCAATSTAMVFHYWKYPSGISTQLPGYTTKTRKIHVDPLSPTTFEWNDMLNSYSGSYTSAQAKAVAKLMRYVGQAEEMDYTSSASGASQSSTLRAALTFGYDSDADILGKKNDESGVVYYSDVNWAAMLQYELSQGRPLIYMGVSKSNSGHAFNLDGYDANNDTYHINFGWSGRHNGYYALNAFEGAGEVYDLYQCYVSGLRPPVVTPTIKVWTNKLYLNCYTQEQAIDYFEVKGSALINDVTMTLNDPSGSFSISETTLPVGEVKEGTYFQIIYHPTTAGSHTATLTLNSNGAKTVSINLYGNASMVLFDPVMLPPSSLSASSFTAQWQDNTPDYNVKCYRLELNHWPSCKTLLEQSFEQLVADPSDMSDWASRLDEITSVPGWTGRRVTLGDGYLNLGDQNFNGHIVTPAIDMSGSDGWITVRAKASCPPGMNSASLKVTCGDNDTVVNLSSDVNEHVIVMPCPTDGSYPVGFYKIVKKEAVRLMAVSIRSGKDNSVINPDEAVRYDNITGKSFTLNGLQPGNYAMRVQAVYIDGSVSAWSEYQQLELKELAGDVNLDNEINIADINTAIDMILAGGQNLIADVNNDGEVNIADINALLDLILSGQ